MTVRVAGLDALPRKARKPSLVKAAVLRAFALEKSKLSGEVSVVFVSRAKMRALNQQYLGHSDDTDVIAFGHERMRGVPAVETPIGDIFISAWMAQRSAKEFDHSISRETLILAAHGALHLLGHDDHTPRARSRMFDRQEQILAALGA